MPAQNILAIAIGDPTKSRTITAGTSLTGVRPYIVGLINYLGQQGITLGTDYTINYQECWEDCEDFSGNPDIIFCMSTPVTRKARDTTGATPIVGVFSEYQAERFDQTQNVCGLNAKRIQIAREYYDKFRANVPSLNSVYALHRAGNTASTKALGNIKAKALQIPLKELWVSPAPNQDIETLIGQIPTGSGLLVLPVDLFFGAADFINAQAAARSLPVFWPVTDWVGPGLCGHGAPQERCGELMGTQVLYILQNRGNIPQAAAARWLTVADSDIKWVCSSAVAKSLNIRLERREDLKLI